MAFKCTNVVDGDTFDVTPGWRHTDGTTGSRVRIAGIDAPEVGRPGAAAATQSLNDAILNKTVVLYGKSISYGRLVADVAVNGVDVKSLL